MRANTASSTIDAEKQPIPLAMNALSFAFHRLSSSIRSTSELLHASSSSPHKKRRPTILPDTFRPEAKFDADISLLEQPVFLVDVDILDRAVWSNSKNCWVVQADKLPQWSPPSTSPVPNMGSPNAWKQTREDRKHRYHKLALANTGSDTESDLEDSDVNTILQQLYHRVPKVSWMGDVHPPMALPNNPLAVEPERSYFIARTPNTTPVSETASDSGDYESWPVHFSPSSEKELEHEDARPDLYMKHTIAPLSVEATKTPAKVRLPAPATALPFWEDYLEDYMKNTMKPLDEPMFPPADLPILAPWPGRVTCPPDGVPLPPSPKERSPPNTQDLQSSSQKKGVWWRRKQVVPGRADPQSPFAWKEEIPRGADPQSPFAWKAEDLIAERVLSLRKKSTNRHFDIHEDEAEVEQSTKTPPLGDLCSDIHMHKYEMKLEPEARELVQILGLLCEKENLGYE